MSSTRYTIARLGVEIFLAAAAGMFVVLLPVLFGAQLPPDYNQTVFLPIVHQAMEASQLVPHGDLLFSALLVAAGFMLGIFGRGPVWLTGPSTMLGLFAWTFIDLIAGGRGHNLFPIEWLCCGFLSLFGLAGAWLGRSVVRRLAKQNPTNDA